MILSEKMKSVNFVDDRMLMIERLYQFICYLYPKNVWNLFISTMWQSQFLLMYKNQYAAGACLSHIDQNVTGDVFEFGTEFGHM